MTREEAKEMMPIIQAFAEGKDIQYRTCPDKWVDIEENERVNFTSSPSDYRIKPEPKYRPFKTKEECWNEMLKHQPFGWVKAYNGELFCIEQVFDAGVTYKYATWSFKEYLENNYTFADGATVGVKEE